MLEISEWLSYLLKMEILQTPRLTLRTWTEQDLDQGFGIWGDSKVMAYVDSGEAQTREQVEASIAAGIRHQEKFGFQHWAVIENISGKLIGACGFNHTEQVDKIELVFHFVRNAWGWGYATEAAKACVDFAFSTFRPNKIIAGCHLENKSSQHVLEKVGFSFIGNTWFEDTQREEPCFELTR